MYRTTQLSTILTQHAATPDTVNMLLEVCLLRTEKEFSRSEETIRQSYSGSERPNEKGTYTCKYTADTKMIFSMHLLSFFKNMSQIVNKQHSTILLFYSIEMRNLKV